MGGATQEPRIGRYRTLKRTAKRVPTALWAGMVIQLGGKCQWFVSTNLLLFPAIDRNPVCDLEMTSAESEWSTVLGATPVKT